MRSVMILLAMLAFAIFVIAGVLLWYPLLKFSIGYWLN